jgi:CspA family cold shock protein
MTQSTLVLAGINESQKEPSGRSRRIAKTEWPRIALRHEQGEPIKDIARDYGVTGPAIRYILNKAEVVRAEAPEVVADEPAPPPVEPAEDDYTAPLAQRLAEVSRACCAAVEVLWRGDGDTTAVKETLHQVGRAVAAIEIDLIKRGQAELRAREPIRQIEPSRLAPSEDLSQTAIKGTVKFFARDKGFGFVTPDDGSKDIFVHIAAVENSGLDALEPMQRVRLTTVKGPKGPMAETVELI